MFLSRVKLDTLKMATRKAIGLPRTMHAVIESCFPAGSGRKLWRIDELYGQTYVLIVSQVKPDFTPLLNQFCSDGTIGETKDYGAFLDGIENGRQYNFCLCANPTYSAKNDVNTGDEYSSGKVFTHVTIEQKKQWLLKHSDGSHEGLTISGGTPTKKLGFSIDPDMFDVTKTKEYRFFKNKKDEKPVVFTKTTYTGVLTVTDKTALVESLRGGIGRNKSYGCGLLTLVPVRA